MMSLTRAVTITALVLLASCQLDGRLVTAGSSVSVLDESGPLDIEAIARVMCAPSARQDGQISRLSTVDKLIEFFDQQVSGESHEFYTCKQLHGAALRQLKEALNASKENVCSAEKLALIEDFHNKFVSRLVEHKKSRKEEQREAAPQLLRLFFMHYAMEVEAVCKSNLVKNLELDLIMKFGADINQRLFDLKDQGSDSHGNAAFGVLFRKAMQKFTDMNPVSKCEDVLMVWDLIENSYLSEELNKDEVTIEDELDPRTGEPIRLLVKLRSPGPLNAIKDHCHYNLKPIYSKLILPIIKLADLGYSNNGEQYSESKGNEQLKLWYSATQICEAILPVKFYEDPSLGSKDFVIITKQEAVKLDAAAVGQNDVGPKVQLVYEPNTNSMVGLDRIESVATVEPKKLIKSVKSNVKARRHVIRRAMLKLVRNLKSGFKKSRSGHIFLSKPTGQSRLAHPKSGVKVEQFVEEEVSQELSESLESMSDEDIEKLESGAPLRMIRTKGGIAEGIRRHGRARRWSDILAHKLFKGRITKEGLLMHVIFFFIVLFYVTFVAFLVALLIG